RESASAAKSLRHVPAPPAKSLHLHTTNTCQGPPRQTSPSPIFQCISMFCLSLCVLRSVCVCVYRTNSHKQKDSNDWKRGLRQTPYKRTHNHQRHSHPWNPLGGNTARVLLACLSMLG